MLRQLLAIVVDTVREARAGKVFVGLVLNGSLMLAVLVWYLRTIANRGPYGNLTVLSQADPRYLDNTYAAAAMLGSASPIAFWTQFVLGLMLMLTLLASLLAPWRTASLIAMPVPRWLILAGRFVGSLLVVSPGVLYPVLGLWVAARLHFGVWHLPFLATFATVMLALSAMVSLMLLLQVISNSPFVVLACLTAAGVLQMAAAEPERLRQLIGSPLLVGAAGHFAGLLPRTHEIAQWTTIYVRSGLTVNAAALWTAPLFTMAALSLAGWAFSRKEF